jgi:hypothetical protein
MEAPMSGAAVDLNSLVEEAWRGFRGAFADALEALDEGGFVQVAFDVGDEVDGAAPYVQALRHGDAIVLEVASNRFLHTRRKLSRPGQGRLRRLGLTTPSKAAPNYWATYPLSHVDQAASVAVAAFRDAFGVLHPAFLVSDDLDWQTHVQLPTTDAVPKVPEAIHPISREHLDRLIDQALIPMLGHTPYRDGDGDIPIRVGSAVIFVASLISAPRIRLFAEMVVEVDNLDAAVHEVAALNREIDGVKFALHGNRVIASADLPAAPFAAEHLHVLVDHMCDVVSRHDAALARRVGGRVFLDPAESISEQNEDECESVEEAIHPVMQCILQLDAERPGSVGPAAAARLCGYDSDLLLELIRWNEEQEIAWRQARDEAYATDEDDEAEVCEIERAHAARTVRVLRKALRRVLLG